MVKEAMAAAAATKALEDEAAKAANTKTKEGGTKEIVLYSYKYYAGPRLVLLGGFTGLCKLKFAW